MCRSQFSQAKTKNEVCFCCWLSVQTLSYTGSNILMSMLNEHILSYAMSQHRDHE